MHILASLIVAGIAGAPAAAGHGEATDAERSVAAAQPVIASGRVVTELDLQCWSVFQAAGGDYWFGSEDRGVFRYDGTTITNYTAADGLAANQIRGIQEDRDGNLYFSTLGGIFKFDGRAFTLLTPVAPTGVENAGWRLDPADLWFPWVQGMPGVEGTEGPFRYDGTTLYHLALPASDRAAEFRAAMPDAGWSPNDVYSIYRDSRGHMWIGTFYCGVCRFDGRSFGWLYEDHLMYTPDGGAFGFRSVMEDRDGAFWICNTNFRFRVEAQNRDGRVVYTREPGIDPALLGGRGIYFESAVADAEGSLWMSTYRRGVWRWDGKAAMNYAVREDGPVGGDEPASGDGRGDGAVRGDGPARGDGQSTEVIRIFQDNAGVVWAGTQWAGPYRLEGEEFAPFRP